MLEALLQFMELLISIILQHAHHHAMGFRQRLIHTQYLVTHTTYIRLVVPQTIATLMEQRLFRCHPVFLNKSS